jgi:hypothetical protein
MAIRSGAGTPEELETLYEDAFVLRDRDAVAQLFDTGAVLVVGDESTEARGAEEIARLAAAMWDRDQTYLAAPRRVLQAHDTTLVVADGAINVLRRRSDGKWRYAISLLNDDTTERQNR